MIKKALKWLAALMLFVIAIVTVVLLLLRFMPDKVLPIASRYSPYQITADDVQLKYWPLTLQFNGLKVDTDSGQPQLYLEQASLTADWWGGFRGRYNFWFAELANGEVNLLTGANSAELNKQSKKQKTVEHNHKPQTKLELHRLISMLNGKIENVSVLISQNSQLRIAQLNTRLNDDTLRDVEKIEQTIDLQLEFMDKQKPINIQGRIESRFIDKQATLLVALKTLNLTPLFGDKSEQPIRKQEPVMDWSWLSNLSPTRLKLDLDKLILADNSIEALIADVIVDNEFEIKQLQGKLDWELTPDYRIQDQVVIQGQFKPISKTTSQDDLQGKVSIKTEAIEVDVSGNVNVNGVIGNALKLQIASAEFPFKTESVEPPFQQFFPLKLSADYQHSELAIEFKNLAASLGDSDLVGQGAINLGDTTKITADLQSKVFLLPAAKEELHDGNKEKANDEVTEQPKAKAKLFNDAPINWAWLDSAQIEADWSVGHLNLRGWEFDNVKLPLRLKDSNLTAALHDTGFSGGQLDVDLQLQNNASAGAGIKLNIDLQNALLEQLSFMKGGEVKRGLTSLNVDLVSEGGSSQQIADALNGSVLLKVSEGVIGNDWFEIIGSDLIMELLDKLNPFTRSDPTTNLNCAVANLKVTDGQIKLDKSLAVETSKMSIVADGGIDLSKETISLDITPKAQNGVGVNVGSLVKFVKLGGTLSKPSPQVSAAGLLKTGVAVSAAISTGGASVLAEGLLDKVAGDACKHASNAFVTQNQGSN